jgi:hypothetical protein
MIKKVSGAGGMKGILPCQRNSPGGNFFPIDLELIKRVAGNFFYDSAHALNEKLLRMLNGAVFSKRAPLVAMGKKLKL